MTTTDTSPDNQLHGLQPTSWGGQVLLGQPLIVPGGGLVESCFLYPAKAQQPPEDTYLVALDFGKRALKVGAVNQFGKFITRVIADAYSAAKLVQQEQEEEEGDGEPEAIWQVIGPDQRPSETFRRGASALRMADMLPVNESIARRLSDARVRNMTISAVVETLQAIGVDATVYEEGEPVVKRRSVMLAIGLPADDLTKHRRQQTEAALATLKGLYQIEQFDTKTGITTSWMIEIVGVIPAPQPRGTHYTATRRLDARTAIKNTIVTIYDIGGGDTYAYEVDSTSGTITEAQRMGDGTIAIARALITLIEEHYGIIISEAQAQEALYTHVLLKGGVEVDISHLISTLRPRFNNLLTSIVITARTLTTFIIFTGGGAALLHEEIQAKMLGLPGKQTEGEAYLIMPVTLAPVANCIGLFALGYYKMHQLIRNVVTDYLEKVRRYQTLQRTLQTPSTVTNKQDQSTLEQLHAELSTHAGRYYQALQQQILREKQG